MEPGAERAEAFDYRGGIHALLERAPLLLLACDGAGIIRCAEGLAFARLGIAPEQLVGRRVLEVLREAPELLRGAEDALGGGWRSDIVRLGHAWMEVYFAPLPEGGAVALACDITERQRALELARQREVQLAEAVRVGNLGLFRWDVATGELTWSDELYQIAGLPRATRPTIEGFFQQVHPDERSQVQAWIEETLRTGRPFHHDLRVLRPRGGLRSVEIAAELLPVAPGAARPGEQHLVGAVHDITDRKRTEEALRRSISLLRATLEATADGILVVGLDGRVVTFNRRFVEEWQLPRELVEQGDDRRLLAAVAEQLSDPAAFQRRIDEIYHAPEAETVDVIAFRDGRRFERYSRPQRIDGRAVGRVWSFRDVTARLRAETERDRLLENEHVARREAEEERRRSAFLADASRLLASLDYATALDGVARLIVPYLADWCAIDLIRFQGEGLRIESDGHGQDESLRLERVALAQSEAVAESLGAALAKLEPRPGAPGPQLRHPEELRQIEQLGMRSYLAVPLQVPGKTLGVLMLVSTRPDRYDRAHVALLGNLAERLALAVENARLYQRAQEALRVREEFIAVASHELNTPITSLLLGLQTLGTYGAQGALEGAEAQAVLARAERQCKHLRTLVNQLIDVSRIQGQQLTLERREVDLSEVVRSVVAASRGDLERARSRVTVEAAEPVRGRWDRLRLEQVVANLLGNALKYGAGKPIVLTVLRKAQAALLRVQDQGIGIAPELQAVIFDRFGRAVSSRHYSGLGLGLYIANEIVHALGGHIRVESRPGQGSRFEVELPLADSETGDRRQATGDRQ